MVEGATAAKRQTTPGFRIPWCDEQDARIGAITTKPESCIEELRGNSLATGRRVNHSNKLNVLSVETVKTKKPEKSIPIPPQQIIGLLDFSAGERSPLELEPTAVDGKCSEFERLDCLQCRDGQALWHFKHRPTVLRGIRADFDVESVPLLRLT